MCAVKIRTMVRVCVYACNMPNLRTLCMTENEPLNQKLRISIGELLSKRSKYQEESNQNKSLYKRSCFGLKGTRSKKNPSTQTRDLCTHCARASRVFSLPSCLKMNAVMTRLMNAVMTRLTISPISWKLRHSYAPSTFYDDNHLLSFTLQSFILVLVMVLLPFLGWKTTSNDHVQFNSHCNAQVHGLRRLFYDVQCGEVWCKTQMSSMSLLLPFCEGQQPALVPNEWGAA